MAKVMLFIDGTWLYHNVFGLAQKYGTQKYGIDYGKLPKVLAEQVGKQLGTTEVDVVRTNLFGSYPVNVDPADDGAVDAQLDFYARLAEEHHYEIEKFAIDFRGRRLRRADRSTSDDFEPKEKCVDIALATLMLYFAAIPYAYDVAIAVIGDRDFLPVLQHVRRLGKRVAIASIKGSCYGGFAEPADPDRVKDFDVIWLDDLLNEIELKYEKHRLECSDPNHRGDKKVYTDYHPRKGEPFYCDECKFRQRKQMAEAEKQFAATSSPRPEGAELATASDLGKKLAGQVWRVINRPKPDGTHETYGFVRAGDGREFFFHLLDFMDKRPFDESLQGLAVEFEIKGLPSVDETGKPKAGKARNVRPVVSQ